MNMPSKIAVSVAVSLGLVLSAGTALAHATYRSSNPGKDASVGSALSEVWVQDVHLTSEPSDAGPTPTPTPTPVPQPEDLPMRSIVTALLVALLIGAGGGFVYNGLMGPRSTGI